MLQICSLVYMNFGPSLRVVARARTTAERVKQLKTAAAKLERRAERPEAAVLEGPSLSQNSAEEPEKPLTSEGALRNAYDFNAPGLSPVKKIAKAMKRTVGAFRQKALSLGVPLGHRRRAEA
jgi:hypothetical protein